MHWSLSKGYARAYNDVTIRGEYEERYRSSIKLQIRPGDWIEKIRKREIRYIGIWMSSNFMEDQLTVVVEEGMVYGSTS
jgi:hypothetical protein